ncbi:aminomethyl-transferring glycine dehydrogenase [Candidatus Woesearchaeota archaeon]|jgi:glycine dehydrogenase subunit 1|nr:aminomethyl-transferring glycine dehydrogenase [Candidatus Woesearchaeota archaeon]|tara:strand:- start:7982 stop:9367 length:1386 start_codon:yes stop_codon:yes gene_type:complete
MHYIPNTEEQKEQMLESIGVKNILDLFMDIPQNLIIKDNLNIPGALSEIEVKRLMENIANKNKTMVSFLGAGAYNHFIPTVVNHLLLRGEFFTAYTPYQPEISQGMLQAIFEYQTMICNLTGMDVANASMYDNSSALAEAAIMACRIKRKDKILISKTVHPEHREVVKTYTNANSIELVELGYYDGQTSIGPHKDFAAIIVQQPNFLGSIEDLDKISKFAHENNALLVVSVNEPTSLGILKSPGSFDADIVVGEGHSFGNALSFGGPYVGFMATKKEFMRQIPGRLAGQTLDSEGRRGFVLTLQAREQHIRREKATSNICTNQALNALAVTITLATLGKELKTSSLHNLQKAHYAANKLKNTGKLLFTAPFYNEFVVKVNDIDKVNDILIKNDIIPGLDLGKFYPELQNCMLICITEMHSKEQIDKLVSYCNEWVSPSDVAEQRGRAQTIVSDEVANGLKN